MIKCFKLKYNPAAINAGASVSPTSDILNESPSNTSFLNAILLPYPVHVGISMGKEIFGEKRP